MRHIIRGCMFCAAVCFGAILYFDSTYQSSLTSKPDSRSGHVIPFKSHGLVYYTSGQLETLRDLLVAGSIFLVLAAYLRKREDEAHRS